MNFFRNLILFRFPEDAITSIAGLAAAIDTRPLRDCGPAELCVTGFVAPVERGGSLTLTSDTIVLFALGKHERILPMAVVNEELAARVDAIQSRTKQAVGGRERRAMKEAIITEFMPRSFVRLRRTLAYVDVETGWLVIDTSSRDVAEEVVAALRAALGSFPATPLTPKSPPRELMTEWLATRDLPVGFFLGDECELREPNDGAIVRCTNQDLCSEEVGQHLAARKEARRLGLRFEDRILFTLCDDLGVKKMRFGDVIVDQLDGAESNEELALSTLALMGLELRHLFTRLELVFDFIRAPTLTLDGGTATGGPK